MDNDGKQYIAKDGYLSWKDGDKSAKKITLKLIPKTLPLKGKSLTFKVKLTAEAGYEWQIGNPYSRYNEQYIGLQLYANYGLYSWSEHTEDPFLSVGAITTASPSPQVSIRSIQSISPLAYMSFGVRCYYTIQTVDYPGRGWHRYHYRPMLVR